MIRLVELERAKAFLQIVHDESQWNELLNRVIIPGVSAEIERWLGRELKHTDSDVTEFFDSDGLTRYVQLKRWPINQDTTTTPAGRVLDVFEDVTRAFPADTEVDASEFVVIEDEGLVYKDTLFPAFFAGSQSIRIRYRGGYKENGGVLCVPEDMKLAALEQVAHAWQRKDSLGASGTNAGPGEITWLGDFKLLASVKAKLSPYKRVRL